MTKRLVKTPVRNVASGPHKTKLRGHAQVFRISQTPEWGSLPEHRARAKAKELRKKFAWGRELGTNNKLYLSYVAVEHKDGRKAHISDLMDQLKAQNEAAGREFRWSYGPPHKKLPSTIWSLRYTNVDHTITGTVVYGL